MANTKTLLVIAGPTASGKTDLAIEIAQAYKTEILSADSRQCYREMNIGTAKPDALQLSTVPHHFIHSHSIHDTVSAGSYETYVLSILETLFTTHDVVVCTGGTGMYIQALCHGLDPMPFVPASEKEAVQQEYDLHGLSWLQEEVKRLDPAFFVQCEQENPARLMRALSFFRTHQASILHFQQQPKAIRPFAIKRWAIDWPREELYQRIHQRVDNMMEAGLLEEVKSLVPFQHLPCLQTVGYTELFRHLAGEYTLETAIDKIKQHTRNYAKRQITWFRNQGDFLWQTPSEIKKSAMILD
jgi:tRNA dimethylallyltransferase